MPYDKNVILKADRLVRNHQTNNPWQIAKELGISIMYRNCERIKGMYAYILRNRFIIADNKLGNSEMKIVLAHELGHDQLHRGSCFGSYMDEWCVSQKNHIREIHANIFSAQLLISDEDFMDLVESEYTYEQIACELNVFPELVNIKAGILRDKGYNINTYDIGSKDYLKNRLKI